MHRDLARRWEIVLRKEIFWAESIRKKIANVLKITKGCVLEIIMKDNHTIGNNPDNIINWVIIAREEIEKV